MQIEKINNNKLRVILNKDDLQEKEIDIHHFMANSLDSQDLFLDILDLAERQFQFHVNNSKLLIESISLSNNIFIFTITKVHNFQNTSTSKSIYVFNNFDDFHEIIPMLKDLALCHVYTYHNHFFVILDSKNPNNQLLNEFCKEIFWTSAEDILREHGTLITLKENKLV